MREFMRVFKFDSYGLWAVKFSPEFEQKWKRGSVAKHVWRKRAKRTTVKGFEEAIFDGD